MTDLKDSPVKPPKTPFTAAELEAESNFAFAVLVLTVVTGLAATIIFVVNPALDFRITDKFVEDGQFIFRHGDFWPFVRRLVMWGYGIVYVILVIGLFRSIFGRQQVWNLYPAQWLYMVVCSLVGPLLVTNLVLKTYIGRPRPRSIIEYGGDLDFVQVFAAGSKCVDNCSFVSGEVSSMVMIFAAAMFASRQWRILFALLLVPAWAFSASLRIGAGAHFPSDALFAGIFMLIIAAALYKIIVLAPQNIMRKRNLGEKAW